MRGTLALQGGEEVRFYYNILSIEEVS